MQDNKTKDLIELKDLLYIWRLIKKNWYLFLLLPMIAGGLAYFKVYPLQDIYGASSSIELSSQDLNSEASYYASWGMTKDYSNEIRAIKSRKLVEKTIDRMGLGVYQYKVGRLKTTDQYPFHYFDIDAAISEPKFYNLPFDIYVNEPGKFKLSYTLDGADPVEEEYSFGERIYKNGLMLQINPAKEFAEMQGYHHQFIVRDRNTIVSQYLGKLSVINSEGSSIADISFSDEVNYRAKTFLDTLGQVYIENSLEFKYEINKNTIKYIDVQLGEITDVLNNIESDIEQYRAAKNILNLSREEELLFSKLLELETEIESTNVKLGNLSELESYLTSEVKMDVLPPNLFIDYKDRFIAETFQHLFDLQTIQREILTKKTEDSPNVKKNQQEIETLKTNLLKYIRNNKRAISSKARDAKSEKKFIEEKLKEFPKSTRQLNDIQRNLEVNEQIYVYLLQKRAETNIAKAGIISDKKIIEPAYSLGIIGPDRKKTYVTFIGAALGLASLIAIVRLLVFDTIDNKQDLENITNLPILGEIAKDDKYDEELGIALEKHPKSHLSESFRSIRTSIEYMGDSDEGCKTILLTSYSSGEGKTFCSVNLAAILSKAQKRVLLIGLDLHKPKFASYLDYDRSKGMTSYLVGKSGLDEVILNHSDYLDIIASGPVPPNASELIFSPKLESLIKSFKNVYDYIVIDSPPVGALSDAIALMKHADINIFVLRSEIAKKSFVRKAEEVKNQHNPSNFVFMLNDVNFKRNKYGYYYSYTDYISG